MVSVCYKGGSWQQKLYDSLECSAMVIALLSDAYMKSKMCNEEFRLSVARHYTEVCYVSRLRLSKIDSIAGLGIKP